MFRYRLITATSTTLKSYFQNSLARVNWRPCRDDIECYLALDSTAMHVGVLNDKPIAMQSLFKHSDGYRHAGGYVVHEAFRDLGYGPILQKECLNKSAPINNLSTYTDSEMSRKLEKTLNFKPRWYVGSYDIDILKALTRLDGTFDPSSVNVKPIGEINLQDLYNYDEDVFGYRREKFLEKWLNTPGTHIRVATKQERSIVGYVVVRVAFIQDEGYKMGPLFGENIEVAKALLKGVFEEIRECGVSSSNSVIADSPIGRNPEAKHLMQLVDGDYLGKLEFMTTNGLPRGRFDDWFVITGVLCG